MSLIIDINDCRISEHRKMELLGEIQEDILIPDESRFILMPIKHPEYWRLYKQSVSRFWTTESVDLSGDYKDFLKLNENEQFFIKMILAFFNSADTLINENLNSNIINEVQYPEARCFYSFQVMMENFHSEQYGLLIESVVRQPEERLRLFNAIQNFEAIKEMKEWYFKYADPKYNSFAERIIANCCFEWIIFSGKFCSIFWLKKRGLMPGLSFANNEISIDEKIHCSFGCLVYRDLKNKLPTSRVYEIVENAVEKEYNFIKDALPVELIGMNSSEMYKYIKFCADQLFVELGCEKKYNVENPFDWMDSISNMSKSNMFEKQISEYSKAGVCVDPSQNKISFTEEF